MLDSIVAQESALRLAAFILFLSLVAVLELVLPRRPLVLGRGQRWVTNLGLLVAGTLVLRLVMPILAVGAAQWAQGRGLGLFPWLDAPFWLGAVLGFVILDLAIYGQHVAFHHVPLLWRLHAVHHSDRDMDLTTALRFHPGEILVSMGYKIALVVMVGIDPVIVILYEITLNGAALLNHGNIRVPGPLDRALRQIVVTPDMHRVHHSVHVVESNRNFGNFLSFWDRLFRTYKAQPDDGHNAMTIGLETHQGPEPARFWWTLAFPAARRSSIDRDPD